MIILHKYKLIFLKTGKTAGTSVEVFLSQFAEEDDIVTPIFPPEPNHTPRNFLGYFNPLNEMIEEWNIRKSIASVKAALRRQKFYNHMPAVKVKNRVSSIIWTEYFKFAIERNPWDKMVSRYNMIVKRNNLSISFSEFLRTYPLNSDMDKYMDSKMKNLIVDKVGKYENLNEELKSILVPRGIPFETLNVRAKSNLQSKQKHYSSYYGNFADIELVRSRYSKEIELFGYEFEDKKSDYGKN